MKAAKNSRAGPSPGNAPRDRTADALARWIDAECLAVELTTKGGRSPKSVTRQKQEALRDALAATHLEGKPLPRSMIEAVYSAAIDVCNGRRPELFEPVMSGKPTAEGARLARQVAGEFIATGPEVKQQQRVERVARLFGVSEKTAIAWSVNARATPDAGFVEPDRWLKAWAGVYGRLRPQVEKSRRRK